MTADPRCGCWPNLSTEPECCDTPMVHNSFTSEYECADAYFELLDDGVLGDIPDLADTDEMTGHQRERFEHWKASRRPDSDGCPVHDLIVCGVLAGECQ